MSSRGGPGSNQSMDKFREEIQRALDKMIEDPEYSPCHDFVRTRLQNSSWNDRVRAECVRVIKESKDERPDISKVVAAVVPVARSLVPPEVKEDLVTLLKNEVLPIVEKYETSAR